MITDPVDGDLRVYFLPGVYTRVGVRGGQEPHDSSLGRERGWAGPNERIGHAGLRLSLTLPCSVEAGLEEQEQEAT